jgi:hypothetical protein
LPGPATPKGRLNELLGSWKAAANESERSKVEKELREVLKGEFQARLGAHEKEIAQLEAKVKRLREQLELRRKKQDDIVDFRVQQLLREAQGLGWGTEPVTTSGVFYSGSRSTVDTTKSGTTSGVFGSVRASSR